MNAAVNRQVLLIEKPKDKLGPEHFRLTETAIPEPKDGEALVKVRYISLDAANRAWMQGATYRAAVETGGVMPGGGIAEVVSSKAAGLEPGDIPQLFDRFYRTRLARESKTEGTGLGLAIVRSIARLHGGDVRAQSTPGVETRFCLVLPHSARHET